MTTARRSRARAFHELTASIAAIDRPVELLARLAEVAGRALGVDRSLVYEVSFERGVVEGLTEWLNPEAPGLTPSIATYPIAAFRGGAEEMRRTRTWVESHAPSPHPMLVADGSAAVLHDQMAIQSLLWYPFAFHGGDGAAAGEVSSFALLVFNQVTRGHPWTAEELEFVAEVAGLVEVALVKTRALRAASTSAARLATVVESLGLCVLFEAEDRRIQYASPAFCTTFGVAGDPGALVGTDCRRVAAEMAALCVDPTGFIDRMAERVAAGRPATADELVLTDGRVLERDYVPLARDLGESGHVWLYRDVTEDRRAAERERALAEKLREAQRLESLGVLAGGIAHDFNNLLTAILGHAELARVRTTDTATLEDLEQVTTGARRAADLCQQLLAYAGRGRMQAVPVQLSQVIAEMAQFLEVSISKRCRLRCELAPDMPVCVVDVTQIRQVILNLIINASDAIGDRDGTITVRAGWRRASELGAVGRGVELPLGVSHVAFVEVRDTGAGMSEEVRARIFEPFFTTKFTGRGLGLAAVNGIVKAHHGVITVESEPGHGSTFTVYLPAQGGPVRAEPADATRPGLDGGVAGLALVADDEEAVRTVACRVLQAIGLTTTTAADGRQAVEVFAHDPDRIRLVILDMTMPRMSGIEALREIRALRPEVPVILSSGYTEDEARLRHEWPRNATFLQKPWALAELQRAVQWALRGR